MGWKRVRDHYRVEHSVQVTSDGICIGSPYIHNIIVVDADGKVKKRYESGRTNEELRRIQDEMDDDPAILRKLVLTADTFDISIPVYTYADGEIIECQCEELGWPNVTHGGSIMYENMFSQNKAQVMQWAKRDAELGVKFARESVVDAEERLAACRERLAKSENDLTKIMNSEDNAK